MRSGPIRRFCSWNPCLHPDRHFVYRCRSDAVDESYDHGTCIQAADTDGTHRRRRLLQDPSVEWDHELGDIGRGINDLSENVSELMEKRLEDEKQKQDLEYKMLQSQINPHFLYNTLNSIKWMATIQGQPVSPR